MEGFGRALSSNVVITSDPNILSQTITIETKPTKLLQAHDHQYQNYKYNANQFLA